jgi:hypothetical protein
MGNVGLDVRGASSQDDVIRSPWDPRPTARPAAGSAYQQRFDLFAALSRAQSRGRWLLVLLVVCVVCNMAAGGAASSQQRVQKEIASGAHVSVWAAERGNAKLPAYWVLQVGSFIATAIVWLFWLHSSYGLLRHLGTKVTRFSPGWAVGCWFVPFVNLVRPYQVVKELRLRSLALNAIAEPEARLAGDLTASWWLTWLAATGAVMLYAARLWSAETAAEVIRADKIGFLGNNMEAIAAVIAYYLVRRIRNAQKLAALPADAPVAPPAA